jgi:phenylpropionate dioxygenase-like ring-hydroxylating dioxygenase large terminal subunit
MSRERLVALAKRRVTHHEAGTLEQEDSIYRVPVGHYYDPVRWQQEVDRIFKRVPLMLAFSCELRSPGSYRAMEVCGMPVLLTRADDGAVRAFVNMCSHRGAIVVPEGTGEGRGFRCPYHAWTYDLHGDLVGVLDEKMFGDLDKSCLGLTPLPVAERAGLIWVTLSPKSSVDIDTFLCGYDEMLEYLGFDRCHLVGRQSIAGPNWKIAYDGYVDLYHLPVLHKDSFGPQMPFRALYDAWGPHQRVTSPGPADPSWTDTPEDEWDESTMIGGVWTIFPHISVADFDAGGKVYMVSQLFPGATAEQSVTVQNFLHTREPDDETPALMERTMAFLRHVVEDEDYYTGLRIQRTVKTGAKQELMFGRNEGGGQRFHGWVQRLIDATDEEVHGLFSSSAQPARD